MIFKRFSLPAMRAVRGGNSFRHDIPARDRQRIRCREPGKAISRQRYRHTDQACNRDHRRKPKLRPRLCHLRTQESWRAHPKPSVEGIVKADGTPGPNFYKAAQQAAIDQQQDAFLLDPEKTTFPRDVLPAPLVGGPKDSYIPGDSLTLAKQSENGLTPAGYQQLVSGGTGQTGQTPDQRITRVNSLPPGPFQLTNTANTASTTTPTLPAPVHRFYQMWQQLDCSLAHATWDNSLRLRRETVSLG